MAKGTGGVIIFPGFLLSLRTRSSTYRYRKHVTDAATVADKSKLCESTMNRSLLPLQCPAAFISLCIDDGVRSALDGHRCDQCPA